MTRAHRLIVCLVLVLGACAGAPTRQRHSRPEEQRDWRAEPHHLSLLMGNSFEVQGEDESAGTLGVDYEYRVSEFLGLGGVAERAFGPIDATTVLATADLHLTESWALQTGPGVEFIEGNEHFVYRVGLLYEWERDGFTISPQLHYDLTSGADTVVFGLAFGIGF